MTSYKLTSILLVICCFSWNAAAFFNTNRGVWCDEFETENGDHTPRAPFFTWKHKVLQTITFTCNDGYKLVGEKTATCMITGEWNQRPECVEIEGEERARIACAMPPLGDNVEVYPQQPGFKLGESVTFVCAGVKKNNGGIRTSQCGEDSEFHPAPPKCIEPRCVQPESPVKGGIRPSKNSYAVGEVVEFKCAKGYEIVGDVNITCGADGYFPVTETVCELVKEVELATCLRPKVRYQQTIQHDKKEYHEGEQIMFSCGRGLELRGEGIIRCMSTGKWSMPSPKCQAIVCEKPQTPEHGNMFFKTKKTYRPGQVAIFYCDGGYAMHGSSKCLCRRNGEFYPKPPTCEGVQY